LIQSAKLLDAKFLTKKFVFSLARLNFD